MVLPGSPEGGGPADLLVEAAQPQAEVLHAKALQQHGTRDAPTAIDTSGKKHISFDPVSAGLPKRDTEPGFDEDLGEEAKQEL